MESDKQKQVAYLVGAGALMFFLGLLGWFLMIGGGSAAAAKQGNASMLLLAGLPLGITILGLALALTGLYIGWKTAFADDSTKPVHDVDDVYIIAAFILDTKGDKIYDPEMFEPEELKHYVQIRLPDGSAREVETAPGLFSSIGEGMRGKATLQGRWLSGFVPNRPSP